MEKRNLKITIIGILIIVNIFTIEFKINKIYAAEPNSIEFKDINTQTYRYNIDTNNLIILNKSSNIVSAYVGDGYIDITFDPSSSNIVTKTKRFTFDSLNNLPYSGGIYSKEGVELHMTKRISWGINYRNPRIIQLGNLYLRNKDNTSYIENYEPTLYEWNDFTGVIGVNVKGNHFPYDFIDHRMNYDDYRMYTTIMDIDYDEYLYNGTIEYIYNTRPFLNLTSTSGNQILSENEGYNKLVISGTVKDEDTGDNLSIKYTIEDSSNNPLIGHDSVVIDNLVANGKNQAFLEHTIIIDDTVPENTYKLIVWTEDDKGGKSNKEVNVFNVEKKGPSISISNIIEGNIYQESVTPIFSADDFSGIKSLKATLNGDVYTSGTEITTGGSKTLTVTAIDNAGNTTQKTINFYINKAPEISLITPHNQILSEIEGYSELVILGTIKDDNVGDNLTIRYTIEDSDNNPLLGYNSELIQNNIIADGTHQAFNNFTINIDNVFAEGNYTLKVFGEDDQGANSEISIPLIIDKTNPSTAPIVLSESNWTSSDVTFILGAATDNYSVFKRQYKIDDEPWTDYLGIVTLSNEGETTIKSRAIDRAGNIGEEEIAMAKIDKTNPEITGIYTYKGTIYVLGEDNNLLDLKPYGFEFLQEATVLEELLVEDDGGFEITLSANSKIPAGTKILKTANSMRVQIPIRLTFSLMDIVENKDRITSINIYHPNKVYYGDVPQNTIDMINAENDKNNKSELEDILNDIIIIDDELSDEVKKIIEDTLKYTTIENSDTPLNSNSGSLTIDISSTFDKLNHDDVQYRFDIVQKDTMNLVYTTTVDDPEIVEIPKLEDSTTYIVRLSIITDGKELAFREIEKTTADRTAPVVEMVKVYNNTLEIKAKDNVMLAEEAYKYDLIDGKIYDEENRISIEIIDEYKFKSLGEVASLSLVGLNLNNDWGFDSWTSKNRIGVDEGSRIKISVRDKEGNYTETEIIANEGNPQLLVNANNPFETVVGIDLAIDDLIKSILDKANILDDINYDYYYIEINTDSAHIVKDKLLINDNGDIIITLVNKITGEKLQYLIKVKEDTSFKRRIIVQKGSRTNLSRAFDYILYRTFNGLEDIEYTAENEYIIIEENEVARAIENGIGIVKAGKGNKELILYIVVSDSIVKAQSNIETFKDNIGYTILKDREVDIINLLDLYALSNRDIVKDYIVIENDNADILKVDKTTIKGLKTGITTIRVIDLINKIARIATFEIVELPKILTDYTDIENHWAEEEIRVLSEKGIIEGTMDGNFRPDDAVTVKEFLVMLNRFKLLVNYNDEKIVKNINLGKDDREYYHISNSIMGITEIELKHVLGNYPNYNRNITREEAAYFIARIFADVVRYKNNEIEFSDLTELKYEAEVKRVISNLILKGYNDETIRPKQYITKAEMAQVINRLLNIVK